MTAPVRVIAVTGAPGVGKTEVGRRLVERAGLPAAVIDTDTMCDVRPWVAGEPIYALIAANLRGCLANYRAWGVRVVVLTGVLLVEGSLAHIPDLLADPGLDWVFYGLRATPDQLASRIAADYKVQDPAGRLSWRHANDLIADVPGIRLIDTSELTVNQVVDQIAAQEFPAAAVPEPSPPAGVDVPVPAATELAVGALCRAGVAVGVAGEVVQELIAAELTGYPSHGLQRIPEYVAAIGTGAVRPHAVPVTHPTGPGGAVVDADRALGVVAKGWVADLLCELAAGHGFAVVAVRNSAHLGRLSPLAEQVTSAGLVLLGFVNCGGSGQKVAPPGGLRGRLATNPIVLGIPASPDRPVIVDTSTSATSEGAVRVALAFGQSLPDGLLTDLDGRPVHDPALLYEQPASVTIDPLGGVAAHRGHALAVGVEVLAGIVAGAGFSTASPPPFRNGALFLAFPADLLGRTLERISAEVAELERHLADCPVRPGHPTPRLPGRRPNQPEPERIRLPAALFRQLQALSEGRPVRSLV